MSPAFASLGAGLTGAAALNVLHETARTQLRNGPHMDLIAMRGLRKVFPRARELRRSELRVMALTGDLISNSLYYASIGPVARRFGGSRAALAWTAAAFGIAAGLGAVLLPPRMGLGQQPTAKWRETAALTFGVYLTGAIVSAISHWRQQSSPASGPEVPDSQRFSGY